MLELPHNGQIGAIVPTAEEKGACPTPFLPSVLTPTVRAKKYGTGRRKRLNEVSKKANDYKGFGQPFEGKFEWYIIEWNHEWLSDEGLEVDLIELHWVKVLKPSKKQRIFYTNAMSFAGISDDKMSVEDFLACVFMGYCSDKNKVPAANAAWLYRANFKGDTEPRDPIGQLYGTWNDDDFQDSLIDTVAFKHCFIDEVVPGEQVERFSKRLKR
jgi:hypothetical protein